MFALALWDRHERTLFLARDRFGEKPLYYGRVGGDFLFASELKAICAHRNFAAEIDRERPEPVRGARLRAGAIVHLPRHLQAHARHDPRR